MTKPFPKTPTFMTIDEPFRFEGEIFDLEIEGEVPAELDGTFYRVAPDPQYPPMLGDANPFNGDGCVSASRFKDGHVDFQNRYVRTERFKAERAARRSLFGHYRNPYTDDPSVEGVVRTVSNTNVVPHKGPKAKVTSSASLTGARRTAATSWCLTRSMWTTGRLPRSSCRCG